jgi:hypothetical protein
MSVPSWLRGRLGGPFLAVALAGALLAVLIRQCLDSPQPSAGPPDDWSIPQLVAYLNGKGLGLRMVSTRKDGIIDQNAFLTTTDRDWKELNGVPKVQEQMHCWSGTLFCLRKASESDWPDRVRFWGDCCLEAGPFVLFGDRELLARVEAALSAFAPPGQTRRTSPPACPSINQR